MPPFVLVVIPLYNAKAYIAAAIRSILEQTYSEFQLLIINDGSTDGSELVARSFHDPRMVIWDQENSGFVSVMNKAIEYACHKSIPYLACMAADDISSNDRLQVQLRLLDQNKSVAACGSNSFYIDSQTEKVIGKSTVPISPSLIKWEIFHGLRGMIEGTCTFRVASLNAIGNFRPTFVQAEDTDIFLRLAERFDLLNSSQYLYRIRLHSESISVKNYRKNVLFHLYALDCSVRRRRGESELTLDSFINSMTFVKKVQAWREEKFLILWRNYLSRKNHASLILASFLSPSRLLSRFLRLLDSLRWQ